LRPADDRASVPRAHPEQEAERVDDDHPSELLLTYAELGERLGISPDGARTRAKRAGWRIIPGNDGRARVRVPLVELPERPPEHDRRATGRKPEQNSVMFGFMTELLARADRAERSAEQARSEAEQTRAALAQRDVALARVEELAKATQAMAQKEIEAARREAEAKIAVHEEQLFDLRRTLEHERARAERLEAELRRPWWKRLFG
jgi:hypothetical protein